MADSLCTFRYKGQEGDEALQLGVIADDIDHLAGYPFVGTKVMIPAKPAVEAKSEVLEERDEEGNIIREYEPAVEARAAEPEQTVHGLNPFPVAMLAIAGYRKLREEVKSLEERLSKIENLPSIKNKLK